MSAPYEPISLEGRAEYLRRLAACPQPPSDLAFANIWGWRDVYGLQWSFGDRHVFIRQTHPETLNWAPVGPWEGEAWAACPRLAEGETRFTRVPEVLATVWQMALGERLSLSDAREHWDYLYDLGEQADLPGNRFHKKKNLFSQFVRSTEYTFHPMTQDCVESALAMQERWCAWRDCESSLTLALENDAIRRVLEHWDVLEGMIGGVIEVKGEIAAYTVAEPLGRDALVIHFEKGDTALKGIYQAIGKLFLEHVRAVHGDRFRVVNREQDLGDSGLRKAKESSNPIGYLKKYEAVVRPA
jgi:hypothetical protein